jgi:hypothetical protein
MTLRMKGSLGMAAAIGTALLVASAGYAQVATTLEQAELAGLSPQLRAEVEARMKQGRQTVYEILTTTLLNRIKAKHLGSEIVALDFNRGIVIVRTPHGRLRASHFDTTTLELKS